jgi:hypothetical protein
MLVDMIDDHQPLDDEDPRLADIYLLHDMLLTGQQRYTTHGQS